MTDQKPLAEALDGYFEVPASRLPYGLRKRVEHAFFPLKWRKLSSSQRLAVAEQSDYQGSQNFHKAQKLWWDHLESVEQVENELQTWKKLVAITVSEKVAKEKYIESLQEKLCKLEADVSCTSPVLPSSNEQSSAAEVGTSEWRKKTAKAAAEARHNKPGGSRDKKRQIQEIWASGKFSTKQLCAEQECAGLGMSYEAARRALVNR